jgi:hypothetical protein
MEGEGQSCYESVIIDIQRFEEAQHPRFPQQLTGGIRHRQVQVTFHLAVVCYKLCKIARNFL